MGYAKIDVRLKGLDSGDRISKKGNDHALQSRGEDHHA